MSGKPKKARSQASRGKTSPQGRKQKRRRVTKSAFALLPVIIVAVVAWIALNSHDESTPAVPSTEDLSPSGTSASNDTDAGDRAAGTPKIVFPETAYDFGTISKGADVSHTFVVRNAGDAPLKLLEVGGS